MNLTREDLTEALSLASENYNRKVSPALAEMFFRRLNNYDRETVNNAFARAMDELKYFPCLAEIVAFIEGDPKKRAEISWAGVLELLQKHGYDGASRKKFQVDGATAWAVERLGGIGGLCRMPANDLNFSRVRYMALYERAVMDGRHLHAAEIYGDKARDAVTQKFFQHEIIAAPETIAPPKQAPALESEAQKLINHQVDLRLVKLAESKSL